VQNESVINGTATAWVVDSRRGGETDEHAKLDGAFDMVVVNETKRGDPGRKTRSLQSPTLACFQKISCSKRTEVKCPALNRLSDFLSYPP